VQDFSPQRPGRPWGPPCLISNGYWGDFSPGIKRLGREVDHSPLSSAEVKNGGAMPSWHSAWLITHTDKLTFFYYEEVESELSSGIDCHCSVQNRLVSLSDMSVFDTLTAKWRLAFGKRSGPYLGAGQLWVSVPEAVPPSCERRLAEAEPPGRRARSSAPRHCARCGETSPFGSGTRPTTKRIVD
jgi:hypothetical protein